ncbi:uncharacterized protein LOC123009737 isoform X2 [Tribolium madens]|uniref:uncharacterized protein LOC123009737 isoform X2 n=1 Tax=Tribolium madens TaxID=41895 RepID=UPI001CF74282|nr:uncharacterized protein LOC123009737 isoform X2 [Tribolium madens]XP_044262179.1 uncharacterized protein LOC123009737 isoform X2 [Tribolium madens]
MSEEDPEIAGLVKCTVISCPNYFHKVLSQADEHIFFDFPSDEDVCATWKEKCGISAYHDVSNSKICSTHFRQTDYTDNTKSVLKPEAIPRENLGWMFGMPEVKLTKTPKFELIKEAVDTNERLVQRFEELMDEMKLLTEKVDLYKKKNENSDKEIFRLRRLIAKYPFKKKNGKIETNLICKVFSQAQINMLLGKKKVVWSYDDMAMAFTLRHIGNRECYLYLKDTLNMPLPSLSAVQRWVASNKS